MGIFGTTSGAAILPGGYTVERWISEAREARGGHGYDAAVSKARAYYLGLAGDLVRQSLAEKFPSSHKRMIAASLSLVPRVVKYKARVFVGPKRGEALEVCDNDGKPVEYAADGTAWTDVLSRASAYRKLMEADRRAELVRRAFLVVTWRDGAAQTRLFWPDDVFIRFAADSYDLDRAHGILLRLAPAVIDGKQVERYEFWCAHEDPQKALNFICDANGKILSDGDGLNPYTDDDDKSIVPITSLATEDEDCGYFVAPRDEVVRTAEQVNTTWTSLLHLAATSGFGQPVLTSTGEGGAAEPLKGKRGSDGHTEIAFGPDELVKVPRGYTLSFESATADFAGVREAVESLLVEFAKLAGMPPSVVLDRPSAASGYALHVENLPLVEQREERVEMHSASVARYIDRLRIVHNTHSGEGARFAGWPRWTPGDLNTPVDPEQQARVDDAKLRQGVTSPIEILMRDEGLTRDEATERYAQLKADNGTREVGGVLGRLLGAGAQGDEPEAMDDADERAQEEAPAEPAAAAPTMPPG